MKKLFLLWFSCVTLALAQPLRLPATSVGLDTAEGQSLWQSSQNKADYWPLIIHYETQQGPAECGPASCVMVLNSLGLEAPANTVHPPFHQFTQTNFFSPAVEKVLPRQTLLHQGATLDELGGMLKAWKLQVSIHHAADSNLDEFRKRAREALASGTQFVIINFHRDPLEQIGGAHFSPLAAYDQASDRFLMLDVARFRYPPYWITAESLFAAMNTTDSQSGKTRGYLLISR
ncbi:MAG: phytochelatin synthase family protein [Vulcanimicrobiota bacterium]